MEAAVEQPLQHQSSDPSSSTQRPPHSSSNGGGIDGAGPSHEGGDGADSAPAGARLESFPLPDSPERRPGLERPSISSSSGSSRADRPIEVPHQQPDLSSSTVRWRGDHASSSSPHSQPGALRSDDSAAPDKNGNAEDGQGEDQQPSGMGRARPGTGLDIMTSGAALKVEQVEWHGRIEQDWYAATAMVDLLTFIYVALFYQVIPALSSLWHS